MKYAISFFFFLFLSTSFFAQYDADFSKIKMLYSEFSIQSHEFLKDNNIDINEANKLNKILESINSAEAQFINTKNGLNEENESKLIYLNAKQCIIDSIADLFYKTTIELTICNNESIVNIPEIMHFDFLKQEIYGFELMIKFNKLIKTLSAVNQDTKISNTEMNMVNSISNEIINFKLLLQDIFSDYDANLKLFIFFDSQLVLIDSLLVQLWDLTDTYYSFSDLTQRSIPYDFYFNYRYPDFDAKKMIILFEKYTVLAQKASEDNKLNDQEIAELIVISKKMDAFDKEMGIKYQNDNVGEEKIAKYLNDRKPYVDKVYEEFFKAMADVYSCEGADKLD